MDVPLGLWTRPNGLADLLSCLHHIDYISLQPSNFSKSCRSLKSIPRYVTGSFATPYLLIGPISGPLFGLPEAYRLFARYSLTDVLHIQTESHRNQFLMNLFPEFNLFKQNLWIEILLLILTPVSRKYYKRNWGCSPKLPILSQSRSINPDIYYERYICLDHFHQRQRFCNI